MWSKHRTVGQRISLPAVGSVSLALDGSNMWRGGTYRASSLALVGGFAFDIETHTIGSFGLDVNVGYTFDQSAHTEDSSRLNILDET